MDKFGIDDWILKNIIEIVKKYDEIERVLVFGSRARGDYKKTSDIDIAIVGKNITHTINTKVFNEINDIYMPYMIDLITVTEEKSEDKLIKNILSEGVEIYAK